MEVHSFPINRILLDTVLGSAGCASRDVSPVGVEVQRCTLEQRLYEAQDRLDDVEGNHRPDDQVEAGLWQADERLQVAVPSLWVALHLDRRETETMLFVRSSKCSSGASIASHVLLESPNRQTGCLL